MIHASDCATHDAPAFAAGACDCRQMAKRPYLGNGEKATQYLAVKLTPSEKVRFDAMARERGVSQVMLILMALNALEDRMAAEQAERIKELEDAIIEIRRRTRLLIEQNTGRWQPGRFEHDKRTVDVLMVNQSIATNALAGCDTYGSEV